MKIVLLTLTETYAKSMEEARTHVLILPEDSYDRHKDYTHNEKYNLIQAEHKPIQKERDYQILACSKCGLRKEIELKASRWYYVEYIADQIEMPGLFGTSYKERMEKVYFSKQTDAWLDKIYDLKQKKTVIDNQLKKISIHCH